MKVLVSPTHDAPWPGNAMIRGALKPHHDCAERSVEILAALQDDLQLDCQFVARVPENTAPPPELALLHAPDYLHYLQTAWEDWSHMPDASFEVRPYITTNRYFPTLRSRVPTVLAGHYLGDGGSPLVKDAWANMQGSVATALAAADAVLAGERSVYALLRPAGHHAMRDMALGGCHIANTALAAQRLVQTLGRVAVLDIDVHHGNGTQQLFYDRDDVLTVSLHGDPATLFPFLSGYSDETGVDAGEGCNFNLPIDAGTDINGYLKHLEAALTRIQDYADTPDYTVIGARIRQLRLPTLFVQEGGYKVDALRANARALVEGVLGIQ